MGFDNAFYWLNVAAKDGSFQPVPQSHRVLGLEYADEEKKADKLTLRIANDDLQHIDSPIWRTGNLVRVGWGYGELVSPERECTIEKPSGGLVLKFEATGGELRANKVFRTRTFRNAKRSDVARLIAAELGFTGSAIIVQDTNERFEQITQARQTDAMFLRRIADREGFEWYVDFDGFHFHERNLSQRPALTLRYHVADREGSDILNFDFAKGVDATRPGAIRFRGINPLTLEEIDYLADNDSTGRSVLGSSLEIVSPADAARHGEPLAERIGTEVLVPTTELTGAAAKRAATGAYKRVQLGAIELNITARGRPNLLAKSLVRVEGFGPTMSGVYYVKSVVHKVVPAPYLMKLKLARDASTMVVVPSEETVPGQGDGVAASGAVNDRAPAENLYEPVTLPDGSVEFRSSTREAL